jgi:uncharacterized protein YjhX (UPF0386 family)
MNYMLFLDCLVRYGQHSLDTRLKVFKTLK